jgi:hypothetical protein
LYTSPKAIIGYLALPYDRSGYRQARDGLFDNRHLPDLAECIFVNVGGSQEEAKMGSPSMPRGSVGGVIVVSGGESLLQGEGPQLVGISGAKVAECQHGGIPSERR